MFYKLLRHIIYVCVELYYVYYIHTPIVLLDLHTLLTAFPSHTYKCDAQASNITVIPH
jgi:hypothetical protein